MATLFSFIPCFMKLEQIQEFKFARRVQTVESALNEHVTVKGGIVYEF